MGSAKSDEVILTAWIRICGELANIVDRMPKVAVVADSALTANVAGKIGAGSTWAPVLSYTLTEIITSMEGRALTVIVKKLLKAFSSLADGDAD